MKKVWYFTPDLPPGNNAASQRAKWFIKALEEKYNVHSISNSGLICKLPNNTSTFVSRFFKENFAGLELFFRILTSRKYYCYIFSSPPFFTVFWAGLAAILMKRKYLLDVRDIYPEVFVFHGIIKAESFAARVLRYMASILYKNASQVITVTYSVQKRIQRTYGIEDVKVIFNGYDQALFYPTNRKFEKFTIVFHGNLGRFQRVDLLPLIAEKINKEYPNIKFLVIGYGPGSKYLKNLPSNMEYLGEMEISALSKIVTKCHLGISLRTDDKISRESFPVKVFEYIGAGIPVIISPISEASNFVEKNKIGLATQNDIQEICEKILKIYGDYKSYQPSLVPSQFERKFQARKIIKYL